MSSLSFYSSKPTTVELPKPTDTSTALEPRMRKLSPEGNRCNSIFSSGIGNDAFGFVLNKENRSSMELGNGDRMPSALEMKNGSITLSSAEIQLRQSEPIGGTRGKVFFSELRGVLSSSTPVRPRVLCKAPLPVAIGKETVDTFNGIKGLEGHKEKAVRSETASLYKASLQAKKDYLINVKGKDANDEEVHVLDKAMNRTDNVLKHVSHAGTNFIKDLLTHCRRHEANKNPGASPEQIMARGLTLMKDGYQPILTNLRRQVVTHDGKEVSAVNRSAALSDFSNNETSILEMKDYFLVKSFVEKNGRGFDLSTKRRLTALYGMGENGQFDKKLLATMRNHITAAYGNELIAQGGDGASLDESKLQAKIDQRQGRLDNLFLQDLLVHVQGGKGPDETKTLHYGRVGLLNMEAPSRIDKRSGLVLNERNQAFDTQQLLRSFDNMEICYDLDDPNSAFVEREDAGEGGKQGVVHLPKSYRPAGMEEGASITLRTTYANISVQGNTKNTGAQQWLNEECIKSLEDKGLPARLHGQVLKEEESLGEGAVSPAVHKIREEKKKLYGEMKQALANQKGGFEVAEKMALFMQSQGALSVNCYGGKDRTGYLLASITFHHCSNHLRSGSGLNERQTSVSETKLAQSLLADHGVAKQIIEDNTSTKAIKILPLDLALYTHRATTMGFLTGLACRLMDFAAAGFSFLAKHQEARLEVNTLTVE